MTDIPISIYSNEDLAQPFQVRKRKPEFASVKKPTLEQTDPVNITGWTFAAGAKSLSGRSIPFTVTVINEATGEFKLTCPKAKVKTLLGEEATWDVVATISGIPDRLYGGPFEVLAGATP